MNSGISRINDKVCFVAFHNTQQFADGLKEVADCFKIETSIPVPEIAGAGGVSLAGAYLVINEKVKEKVKD